MPITPHLYETLVSPVVTNTPLSASSSSSTNVATNSHVYQATAPSSFSPSTASSDAPAVATAVPPLLSIDNVVPATEIDAINKSVDETKDVNQKRDTQYQLVSH